MKYLLPLMIVLALFLSGCSGNSSGQAVIAKTQAAQLTAAAAMIGSATSPTIGMTPDQVLKLWGYPQEIHQDTISGEQWLYPNNQSVYFENGTVSKVQN
jgi:hypothetical protein